MSNAAGRWRRLEEIVHAALERPAEQRAEFLQGACAGDDDLRRDAASLIEREARAEGFLATPLGELAANAVTYSPGGTRRDTPPRQIIGARIGVYEIRERLGAGGMGEVYRARDQSLHRDVALKVLPSAFLADPERLARFEREARLLATLNHPHIGSVYGLEGSGDFRAIVLELIEGETLEARLKNGPLAGAQALALAVQIAEALDHAHQRGVTHRDLKPANIMLTKAGAKLLDFGLAKWSHSPAGYVAATMPGGPARPEGVESLTSEGAILGTLHYMAPEQIEGKAADARADVFSFGAVLYEMLVGRKAFDGESAASVMAAVLKTEPSGLDTLVTLAPPALERVVRKCLAKDPGERWQTMRDLVDALKWIAADLGRGSGAVDRGLARDVPRSTGDRPRQLNLRVAALAVAVASALAGWAGWRLAPARDRAATEAVTRFSVEPRATQVGDFDISPDGSALVYAANRVGQPAQFGLFLRRLDQFGDAPIAGTDGGNSPLFSPDGQWVAFFQVNRLFKVNVRTAAAPILLSSNINRWLNGASWLADGTIIFSRPMSGLQRVSAEGGEPTTVTKLSETPQEFDHHAPQLLPDGHTLLFTLHRSNGRFDLAVEDVPSGKRKVLVESAYDARYVPTGHLVFARQGAILAVPFSLQRLEVTGPPVPLVEDVADGSIDGNGFYRLSQDGTLVYQPQPSRNGRTLTWVDRSGTESPIPLAPRAFTSPSVSPDGRQLAFAVAEGGRRDIWTYDLSADKLARVTREGDNRIPVWSPDGRYLTYASMRGDTGQLMWQPADGSGAPESLASGGILLAPGSWTNDLRSHFYWDGNSGPSGSNLFILSREGPRTPAPVLSGPGSRRQPRLSPDGKWLAYVSAETGRVEVYVSDVPAFAAHRQITVDGGRQPRWSRDGRSIYYRFGSGVFAVPVETALGFSVGKPRLVADGSYVLGGSEALGYDYDLAPDGRLLMIKPGPEEQAPSGLRVVLNWVDELARRVPKGQ